jgi:glycosyltransferase involved in cell wall biosynthesis
MDHRLNIFIPSLNRKELLLETLASLPILTPEGKNLVLDITVLGNSNDGSESAINDLFGDKVKYSGESDLGLYDALGKSLSKVTEGYVTWLGAGDKWEKDANITIEKMIAKNIKWFTGRPLKYDIKGEIFEIFPVRQYKSRLIVEGWYNGFLPFIQQESTIWHASLHHEVDWNNFRQLKLAGDYYLWTCFARKENIFSCQNHIGGYRIHDNSLSSMFLDEYKNEIKIFTTRSTLGKFIAYKERIKIIIYNIFSKFLNLI